ncbi:MAG: hypothetical protein JXR58_04060, partial [Bacteroidales bacterium]|nr:hypothetical protein [Bacteroidales bacterium]
MKILKPQYYIWFGLFLVFFILGISLERSEIHIRKQIINVEDFEKVIEAKQKEVENYVLELSKHLKENTLNEYIEKNRNYIFDKANDGYDLLIFRNDSLKFWTNNSLSVSSLFSTSVLGREVVFLGNAWYLAKWNQIDNQIIVCLAWIKKEYPFENEFLTNDFHPDFSLSPEILITVLPAPEAYAVNDEQGNYILSLIPKNQNIHNIGWENFILFCYGLSLIFLLIFFYVMVVALKEQLNPNFLLLALFIDFVLVLYILRLTEFSDVIINSELFSPKIFAASTNFPSLGWVLLYLSFLFVFSLSFHKHFSVGKFFLKKYKNFSFAILLCLLIVSFSLLYNVNELIISLVFNSSMELQAFKVFGLSIYSGIAFLIIALAYSSVILLIISILSTFKPIINKTTVFSLAIVFFIPLFHFIPEFFFWGFILSGLLIYFFICFAIFFNNSFKNYIILLIMAVLSMYNVILISNLSEIKELEKRKIIATGLATERDLVTEIMLEKKEKKMLEDETIKEYLENYSENNLQLIKHLRNYYFNGYLTKYDFQIVHCYPNDSLLPEPSANVYNCYEYYDFVLKNQIPIPKTNFYFLDNLNGRISYLGKLPFLTKNDSIPGLLFIQLDSRLISEELGYPDLLLENKQKKSPLLKNYSYAKYNNGKLITQSGDYEYSMESSVYGNSGNEFSESFFDNYHHLLYKLDDENLIVVSKPQPGILDIFVSFSYVFVFFYLLYSFTLLINYLPKLIKGFNLNFKLRIQISIISILLLSLVIIAGFTVYYNIQQYRNKLDSNISEKIQSVLIELEHKIGNEDKLIDDPFFREQVTY